MYSFSINIFIEKRNQSCTLMIVLLSRTTSNLRWIVQQDGVGYKCSALMCFRQ
jgi:hypothetical protein